MSTTVEFALGKSFSQATSGVMPATSRSHARIGHPVLVLFEIATPLHTKDGPNEAATFQRIQPAGLGPVAGPENVVIRRARDPLEDRAILSHRKVLALAVPLIRETDREEDRVLYRSGGSDLSIEPGSFGRNSPKRHWNLYASRALQPSFMSGLAMHLSNAASYQKTSTPTAQSKDPRRRLHTVSWNSRFA